jgi:glycerol-3-phosphate dehydrogenase
MTSAAQGQREPLRERIYWWAWFKWHARFEWCLCECDFCGRRLLHEAACEGTSRIRRPSRV